MTVVGQHEVGRCRLPGLNVADRTTLPSHDAFEQSLETFLLSGNQNIIDRFLFAQEEGGGQLVASSFQLVELTQL